METTGDLRTIVISGDLDLNGFLNYDQTDLLSQEAKLVGIDDCIFIPLSNSRAFIRFDFGGFKTDKRNATNFSFAEKVAHLVHELNEENISLTGIITLESKSRVQTLQVENGKVFVTVEDETVSISNQRPVEVELTVRAFS